MPDENIIGKQPGAQPRRGGSEGASGHNGAHAALPEPEEPIEAARRAKYGGARMVKMRVEEKERIEREQAKRAASAPTLPLPKWPKPFPGVMRKTVAAVMDASPKPRLNVATMAVLVAFAACIPGTVHGRGGMRCNLYGTCVLPTVGGKDMPRAAAEHIVAMAGAKVEGKPASGSAMDELVAPHMPSLVTIDEVAHLLLASKDKNAPGYLRDLQASKLKLFSAGQSAYLIRKHATGGRRVKEPEARRVPHPCLSMLSFSTPETMAQALSSASVSTGDVPRELFLCDETKVKQVWPKSGFIPPPLLVDRAIEFRNLIDEAQLITDISAHAHMHEVPMTGEAQAALTRIMESYSMDDDETNLTGRHWEKVFRAALVVASWDNPKAPLMRYRHVVWAEALVTASDRSVAAYFAGRVHDDQRMTEAERVRGVIERLMKDKQRVTWSAALKGSNLYAPQFAHAVAHLEDSGVLEVEAVDEGGQRPKRYLARGPTWV